MPFPRSPARTPRVPEVDRGFVYLCLSLSLIIVLASADLLPSTRLTYQFGPTLPSLDVRTVVDGLVRDVEAAESRSAAKERER